MSTKPNPDDVLRDERAEIAEFVRRYNEFCDLQLMHMAYRKAEEQRLQSEDNALWAVFKQILADVEAAGLPTDILNGKQ